MGHTPGPWQIGGGRNGHYGIFAGVEQMNVYTIAWTANNNARRTPTAAANAVLISAAPDLLAACKLSKSTMRRQFVDGNAPDSWGDDEHAAFTALSAAIARAEGTK